MNIAKFFKSQITKEQNKFIELASTNSMLSRLSSSELLLLYPHFQKRTYKENEVVFFAGDPARVIYLLEKGKVVLNIEHQERLEKLTSIRKGELFGESAVIDMNKQPRVYTAIVASEKATIHVIASAAFRDILKSNTKMDAKIHRFLANQYVSYVNKLFLLYRKETTFFEMEKLHKDYDYED